MFCQTLIRLLRTFGQPATVEMITLSMVFSILLVMWHHMPPTNCRVSLRAMTTSAHHWLASNMKPLLSTRPITLVKFSLTSVKTLKPFFFYNILTVLHLGLVYMEVCIGSLARIMTETLAGSRAVVLGTHCQEHNAVSFCCANSSLSHVCP